MKILILHGPNLNLLGKREPQQYGSITLDEINELIKEFGKEKKIDIDIFNSNYEGEIIDRIHNAIDNFDGIVINPGAFTHTSIAIRDAIVACGIPTVEVHLSNIYKREEFRHKSYFSDIVVGVITGFKEQSYILGIRAIMHCIKHVA